MQQSYIFLAFGFTNLAMLGWLAAAAAPLLIHLWSRNRYREVPWAAIEFLRAALKKNARRTKLQQWLLLAVRTLLIVAVVTALAEPFSDQSSAGNALGVPTHRVLVLDRSFSMRYQPSNESHFDLIRKLALQKIKQSGSADTFSIVVMDRSPETIVMGPSLDRTATMEAVTKINVGESIGDLKATLELVRELIANASAGIPAPPRQEVVFFTDLTRASWNSATQDEANQEENSTEKLITEIAELATLSIVDIGTADAHNLAIVDFYANPTNVVTETEISFRGRIANFGANTCDETLIQLFLDDQPVAEQTISIPAGGETSVTFSRHLKTPGEHVIGLMLADDQLPIDNTRWLVVSVDEQIPVLCVAGQQGEANYVARAINPDEDDSSVVSPLRATTIADGQLRDTSLERYRCIVLCNVPQITTDEAALLKQHLRRGGGLIIFLGDRVQIEQYNQVLASANSSEGILPAKLSQSTAVSAYGIDPLDYRHPIVQPFRGRERAGLLTTPVFRYIRVEPPKDQPNVETVVALANGDPLIVSSTTNQGRTLLVTTAGSLRSVDESTGQPWSAMAAWPSFLPLVREMVHYSFAGNETNSSLLVGEPLSGSFVSASSIDTTTIVRPNGLHDSIEFPQGKHNGEWNYHGTDLSGRYKLQIGEETQETFAVNVDPVESDLARINPSKLRSEFRIDNPNNSTTSNLSGDYSQSDSFIGKLLVLALCLALLEVGLAWGMGGGRQ